MFLKFGLNEMHKVLTDAAEGRMVYRDIHEEELSNAREVIFAVPTKHSKVDLLVYSTFAPGEQESRDYAKDSVKFVLRYRGKRTRYTGNYKRVFRNSKDGEADGFLARVIEEVKILMDMAVPLKRCACHSLLVPRYMKGNAHWFMGCIEYPNCKGTNVSEDVA